MKIKAWCWFCGRRCGKWRVRQPFGWPVPAHLKCIPADPSNPYKLMRR